MSAATKKRRRRPVSFNVSADDNAVIAAIARRAVRDGIVDLTADTGAVDPQTSLEMDLAAVMANDAPLDLERLITLPAFDFTHDILGIQKHIDRTTGRLLLRFEPRCGRRVSA
ncbi:MAG: hypothetical protein KF709_02490 [Gemmatimonadaceae bacterium]|nr:hypothetical protein [Gemmatimonadaceae bacterium]